MILKSVGWGSRDCRNHHMSFPDPRHEEGRVCSLTAFLAANFDMTFLQGLHNPDGTTYGPTSFAA